MKKLITAVLKGSIADELEIVAGDFLVSINGQPILDILDFRMAQTLENLEILVYKQDDEEWLLEIEKDEDEELGLIFEDGAKGADGLMDKMRHCGNNCIFCFIDQNAPNMRPSLYIKDDDYRLSFLHGNYITLTNMSEADINRILTHRISPVNISIHSTDPAIRTAMMGNPKAGRSLDFLDKLADGGIVLAMQIVLCKGYNDGAHLDKTISDLSKFAGNGASLSVVPVGLTKYRKGLTPLAPLDRNDSIKVLEQIKYWQNKILAQKGSRFVFAADEFYLKAGADLPDYEEYEDFAQIDNGVGMLCAFRCEFKAGLKGQRSEVRGQNVTLVTGVAAAPFMRDLVGQIPNVQVRAIVNEFYGENITVAGLLTGRDIVKQLQGQDLGDLVLLPKNCLRVDEDVFLDDMTLSEIEKRLKTKVLALEPTGDELVRSLLCNQL
jgi:putative radical SAM enzyme (TIGR03279 family)